jgi:phosphate acyltransferase
LTDQLTIALDGMGGDNAPDAVLEGADIARVAYPDVRFLIFGDSEQLTPRLDALPALKAVSEIRHTDQSVSSEEKPSQALRRGRGSSMGLAIGAVRAGEASAAVSSGNTGALMAMAKFMLKTMPGINRPALASSFPTLGDDVAMLDMGANVECDAENLVQFAIMGAEYARAVLGRSQPRVGLLNVGVEDVKGHDAVRGAGETLKTMRGAFDFAGFVEGDGISKGDLDVIVTDGFTGNIAIKTAEGTAHMFSVFLAQAFRSSVLSKIGYLLSRGALSWVRKRMDPRGYNGGVFLGLNGLVVKSHGGTDAQGFSSALGVAVRMAANDLPDRIRQGLEIGEEGQVAPASLGAGE